MLRLTATLQAFNASATSHLSEIRRGIEKESLRIDQFGFLAQTPHPSALGSPLTHSHITTDFSEAQLELITGVHTKIPSLLNELTEIHQFVYQALGDELLWAASMPCMLNADKQIPVGQYGNSNIAKLKTVYRLGLGLRYGRPMQAISGIHFNLSLSDACWQQLLQIEGSRLNLQDFKTQRSLDMIRNFRRQSWLPIYLFGASPALCKSFKADHNQGYGLEEFDKDTLFKPYATSLRMGGLGYQSDTQATMKVSFNSLAHYVKTLKVGLTKPYPPYVASGIQQASGEYQQLSTNLLQIENEFYGVIRPKCIGESGERPLNALARKGVEYVEVRLLDVNPFLSIGIDATTVRLLDLLLLQCLLTESPADSDSEIDREEHNRQQVVKAGRQPMLKLQTAEGEQSLAKLAATALAQCEPIALALDKAGDDNSYQECLKEQRRRIAHPAQTLSGRIMADMAARKLPFFRFAMDQSLAHSQWFHAHPLAANRMAEMHQNATQSILDRQVVEASDEVDFETFRARYIKQPLPVIAP